MLFCNFFLLVGVSTASARSVREFLHREIVLSLCLDAIFALRMPFENSKLD
jgi:hypothetical protein